MRGRLALAAAAMLVASAAVPRAQDPAPDKPTFSAAVDAVSIDVLVTDDGRPISGLGIEDFLVRDNGIVQRLVSVSRDHRPLDVFVVLDRSYSVAGRPLEALREAARLLLEELAPEDRATLLSFSHALHMPAALTTDRGAVRGALDSLQPGGATSLFDAVFAALLLREGTPHRAMILVFSDGRDTSSWTRPEAVVELARQTDAVIYGITLQREEPPAPPPVLRGRAGTLMIAAPPADRDESGTASVFLERITDASGGEVLGTENPRRLRDLFLRALRDMKARYTLTYVPEGVDRKGWHAIDVELTRRKADVTARAGYVVP